MAPTGACLFPVRPTEFTFRFKFFHDQVQAPASKKNKNGITNSVMHVLPHKTYRLSWLYLLHYSALSEKYMKRIVGIKHELVRYFNPSNTGATFFQSSRARNFLKT